MAENVTMFVACDHVIQDSATSKITLVGLFDALHLNRLPAQPASPWFLFAKINNFGAGQRNLKIEILEGAEGDVIYTTRQEIPSEHGSSANIIVGTQTATFRSEGPHTAKLSLDGVEMAEFQFDVRLIS